MAAHGYLGGSNFNNNEGRGRGRGRGGGGNHGHQHWRYEGGTGRGGWGGGNYGTPFELRWEVVTRTPVATEPMPGWVLERPTSMDIHKAALGYAFDPDLFLAAWLKYQSNRAAIKCLRQAVQAGTIVSCLRGGYALPNGTTVEISKDAQLNAALNTKLYPNDYTYTIPTPPSTPCCPVEVREADCIEVALELKQRGLNPAVLNMASASHPGGGYKTGAGAQEENLHRRTSLFHCLEDPYRVNPHRLWRYPIPEFGVLYSPNVPTFRQSEAHAYAFLDTVQELSYISAAAYNQPPLDTDRTTGDPILSGKVLRDTEHKIHVIFQVAIENGHDSLVLSALGCGAYGNPPVSIALLIKQALRQYGQYFQTVAIAVIDDHNTRKIHNPHGNVEPFKRVFS